MIRNSITAIGHTVIRKPGPRIPGLSWGMVRMREPGDEAPPRRTTLLTTFTLVSGPFPVLTPLTLLSAATCCAGRGGTGSPCQALARRHETPASAIKPRLTQRPRRGGHPSLRRQPWIHGRGCETKAQLQQGRVTKALGLHSNRKHTGNAVSYVLSPIEEVSQPAPGGLDGRATHLHTCRKGP